MKICIIGNSGSGKSTLAHHYAQRRGCQTLDLDTIARDQTSTDPRRASTSQREPIIQQRCQQENRIIEGCYGEIISSALPYNPILYRLDIPPEICIANNTNRAREPHKFSIQQAQIDHVVFLNNWIAQYHHHTDDLGYAFHHKLFESYQGEKYRLIAFSCG